MILALLLAAGTSQTALDAERAFDMAAAREGQWTAFHEFAAPDAVMFVPEAVKAQDWLKDRKDPPKSVRWQPAASYVSCDGSVAVNTGSWQRPDGSVGYFTTVWKRASKGGWKWLVDRGDSLDAPKAVPATPVVRKAACPAKPLPLARINHRSGTSDDGASPDGSLQYHWWDGGGTTLEVEIWTGNKFETVIRDASARSPAK